jgi:hypothetical protein
VNIAKNLSLLKFFLIKQMIMIIICLLLGLAFIKEFTDELAEFTDKGQQLL